MLAALRAHGKALTFPQPQIISGAAIMIEPIDPGDRRTSTALESVGSGLSHSGTAHQHLRVKQLEEASVMPPYVVDNRRQPSPNRQISNFSWEIFLRCAISAPLLTITGDFLMSQHVQGISRKNANFCL